MPRTLPANPPGAQIRCRPRTGGNATMPPYPGRPDPVPRHRRPGRRPLAVCVAVLLPVVGTRRSRGALGVPAASYARALTAPGPPTCGPPPSSGCATTVGDRWSTSWRTGGTRATGRRATRRRPATCPRPSLHRSRRARRIRGAPGLLRCRSCAACRRWRTRRRGCRTPVPSRRRRRSARDRRRQAGRSRCTGPQACRTSWRPT